MYKISFLIILPLIFYCLAGIAQNQVIYNNTYNEQFLFRYGSDGGGMYKNLIIMTLAEGNGKNQNNTQFTLSYTENAKILKSGNYAEFLVLDDQIKITGDIFYKYFPVDETLIPAKVSFIAQWQDANNKIIKTFTIRDVKFSTNYEPIFDNRELDTLNKNNYKLIITNKTFEYDYRNKQMFDDKITQINNYYANARQVKDALNSIHRIVIDEVALSNVENPDFLNEYKITADRHLRTARSVRSMDFFRILPINQIDPENIYRNLEDLENYCNNLLISCDRVISRFDEIYYNRGMNAAMRGNRQLADDFFNKSLRINPGFAPSRFQLAFSDYKNRNYQAATEKLINIQQNGTDIQLQKDVNELAFNIYSDYLNDAVYQNNNQNYDNALISLDKANYMASNFRAISIGNDFDEQYFKAIVGKYNQLLAQIDRAITSNELPQAENMIEAAKSFQVSNSRYITDQELIKQRHRQVYFDYLTKGDLYLSQKNYDRALTQYNSAKRICTSFNYVTCTDNLNKSITAVHTGKYKQKIDDAQNEYQRGNLDRAENILVDADRYQYEYALTKDPKAENLLIQLKQTKYKNYINDGNSFTQTGNYEKALFNYDQARLIEANYKIIPDKTLEQNTKSAAKKLIFSKIESGESKVAVNDLYSARNYYTEAIKLQRQYNLLTDQETIRLLNNFNDKIFKQECTNYKNNYNEKLNQAINLITTKDFIQAYSFLNEAINITTTYSYCFIDASEAKTKKMEIEPAYLYQKQMTDVKALADKMFLRESVENFEKAEQFFTQQNIETKFGLKHQALSEFAKKQNSDFVNFTCMHYINKNDNETALNLLNELKYRTFDRSNTEQQQILLGINFARRDKQNNPSQNPKQSVLQYTKDDNWYKYFKKSYIKEWKK